SKSSSSTSPSPSPSSRACAATSSLPLYESRRRLPLMPRTFSMSLRLHQVQLGGQRDVVRERRLAVRERVVPVNAELRPVDRRLELQPEARAAERIPCRLA